MTEPIPPLPDHKREELRNQLMLIIIASLALVFTAIVIIVFLLPKVAPPPIQFLNNPSPVASNPDDPDHWDFSNSNPVFHPGDAIIVEVAACVLDPFGGSSIHVSGFRRLVSDNGLVSDQLSGTDVIVAIRPCMISHTNAGNISRATPSGRYRVEAHVYATTSLYTRDSEWHTIWFEVQNP